MPVYVLMVSLAFCAALARPAAARQTGAVMTARVTLPSPGEKEVVDRERDGLLGRVREVRTERARLTPGAGRPVEGARVVMAVASYDRSGKKVGEKQYPVAADASSSGTESYSYDEKGNISETVFRKADNTVLRRETYAYEYDDAGNWTKMTTYRADPIGASRQGDPFEVTYRAITYFPDETASTTAGPPPSASLTASGPGRAAPPSAPETKPSGDSVAAADAGVPPASTPAPSSVGDGLGAQPPGGAGLGTSGETAGERSAAKPAVSGEIVVGKMLSMPKPAYPEAARRLNLRGVVDVEVDVNEYGEVTSARPLNGHLVLHASATRSALLARFTPTLLSGRPTKTLGTIRFIFNGVDSATNMASPATPPPPRPETRLVGTAGPPEQKGALPSPAEVPAAAAPASALKNEAVVVPKVSTVYRVGPGDVLDIKLPGEDRRKSSLYVVQSSGQLEHPLLDKPLTAAGKTTDELGAELTTELKRRGQPEKGEAWVGVREYVSHTVLVSGLVDVPGPVVLRYEAMPLFTVLAQARLRPEAGQVVITSAHNGLVKAVNLGDPSATAAIIQAGDTIHAVPPPPEFYFVGGEVKAPGRKDYYLGLTLTQALFDAEGLTRPNSKKIVVRVARQKADGTLTWQDYGLADIESGVAPDPALRPGDRVTFGRGKE